LIVSIHILLIFSQDKIDHSIKFIYVKLNNTRTISTLQLYENCKSSTK